MVHTDGQEMEYGILFAADVRNNLSVNFTDLMFTQVRQFKVTIYVYKEFSIFNIMLIVIQILHSMILFSNLLS